MDKVFFNRVPKTGSVQMLNLIKTLKVISNYQVKNYDGNVVVKLKSPELENNLAENITDEPEPSIYVKHISYINFKKYDLPQPIYINLIRDPVERLISWYFYRRSPWIFLYMHKKQGRRLPQPDFVKKDFETCVLEDDPECRYEQGEDIFKTNRAYSQVVFFCGQSKECKYFNSVTALQLAKRRVEKEFAVVGTWEETNITLKVLENYIPKYFKGATDIYYIKNLANDPKNSNPYKPKISEKVKEIMRRNLTNEIELHEFCKQRLYKQYLALFPELYEDES